MRFDKNLAVIHAYLCADGYVVRNSQKQKHKYYRIGLRNTNMTLLKDFQQKFKNYFGISPKIRKNRCELNSKEIYFMLIKMNSFYSKEWILPNLSKSLLKYWLRAFFDCEGWVFVKTRQNRHIGVESINHKGLLDIKEALLKFSISCKLNQRKSRSISRLEIYGKDNIEKFQKNIDFLHAEKKTKLKKAISSYVNYAWRVPSNKSELKSFLQDKFKVKKPFTLRINSIKKQNLIKLSRALKEKFDISSKIYGPYTNGLGNSYFVLQIHKKSDILSILKQNLLNKEQKTKLSSNLFK